MRMIGISALIAIFLPATAFLQAPVKTSGVSRPLITVRQVFPDFPAVRMGMKYKAARAELSSAGMRPVSLGSSQTEVAWEGTFDGVMGRGTLLLEPKRGVWEIAAVVYAMEKRDEIQRRWIQKVESVSGPATEVITDETAKSYVWRRGKMVLEIRTVTDVNSPVVDIHWVNEK